MAEKPPKDEYDIFIIEKTFPNPESILKTVHPPVKEIVKKCLFVLDANTMLAPFAVGKESLSEVNRVFRQLVNDNRLFLPAQAVREYARNRTKQVAVIYEHLNNRISQLPQSPKSLQTPMFEGTDSYQETADKADALTKAIKEYKRALNAMLDEVENWNWNDPVTSLYANIFSASQIIQPDLTHDQLKKDLHWRTMHKLPPGYMDQSKPDGGIGDVVIWHTILKLGKDQKKPIVFVTNDEKPDWQVSMNKQALFPRYELVEEFFRVTGQHFALLSFADLLSEQGAKKETIEEVSLSRDEMTQAVEVIELPLSGGTAMPPEIYQSLRYLQQRLTLQLHEWGPHSARLAAELRGVLLRTAEILHGYYTKDLWNRGILSSILNPLMRVLALDGHLANTFSIMTASELRDAVTTLHAALSSALTQA